MLKRYESWLATASVGDKIMYMQADHASRRPEVQQFFWQAARDGKVFLYQKRARAGVYKYYAKRISEKSGKILKPWEMEDE